MAPTDARRNLRIMSFPSIKGASLMYTVSIAVNLNKPLAVLILMGCYLSATSLPFWVA
jgi:hypothetical protein